MPPATRRRCQIGWLCFSKCLNFFALWEIYYLGIYRQGIYIYIVLYIYIYVIIYIIYIYIIDIYILYTYIYIYIIYIPAKLVSQEKLQLSRNRKIYLDSCNSPVVPTNSRNGKKNLQFLRFSGCFGFS